MKETKGLVIELPRADRSNLKLLQRRLEDIAVEKTLSELALQCLRIGLISKLKNLKNENNTNY